VIVWVWHCPKCGVADAIYFDEGEAGDYVESDSCQSCGYDGGFDMHEVSEDEAVEAGWMVESQYASPYMDGGEQEPDGDYESGDDAPEDYGYGWQVRQ
jgi:Zn ribbon nucleic-acid-binding protein